MPTKTKTFDCVEMKRKAARRIYEETRALSFAEKVEYWKRQSEQFRHMHEAANKAAPSRDHSSQSRPGTPG